MIAIGPLAAALVAALHSLPAQGPTDALRDRDAVAARIDALVRPYEAAGMFNGVILVAHGDTIVATRAYGQAEYALGVPNTPTTRFRIASLSKQFTEAALATLMDEGKVRPEDRLAKFLPDFPRASDITIDMLVNHRSGVPHTNDVPALEGVNRITLDSMVRLLASLPLDFEPGTSEKYSNGGYDLLAAVIEKASGLPYSTYLQRAVFDRLGLRSTGVLHTYEVVPGMATGYVPGRAPGGHDEARFYPSELRIGGGALYSDAADVFTLFRATFQRRFASESTSDLLFWDRTKRYEITGRSPGFVAKVFIDIPNDITIVSLANNYSFLTAWGRRLYQAAIDDAYPMADLTPARTPDLPHAAAYYEGRFAAQYSRGELSVDGTGHLLFSDDEGDWRVAMVPLADGSLLHPFFDLTCRPEGDQQAEALVCQSVSRNFADTTRFAREGGAK